MKRICLLCVAALALLAFLDATASLAQAGFPLGIPADDSATVAQSRGMPWHGAYYDPAWGVPVALVVPPTAEFQSNYSWGVCGTRTSRIYHQFGRNYPGGEGTGPFYPTPYWPNDTQQFGVYYVRGPWGTYR